MESQLPRTGASIDMHFCCFDTISKGAISISRVIGGLDTRKQSSVILTVNLRMEGKVEQLVSPRDGKFCI